MFYWNIWKEDKITTKGFLILRLRYQDISQAQRTSNVSMKTPLSMKTNEHTNSTRKKQLWFFKPRKPSNVKVFSRVNGCDNNELTSFLLCSNRVPPPLTMKCLSEKSYHATKSCLVQNISQKKCKWVFPVAQWLRVCLPMQGTQVRSLVGKILHAT